MRIGIVLTLLLLAGLARAFQCAPASLEDQFLDADRVFLVFVTDTKLESGDKIGLDTEDLKYVRPISAGYEVIEEFKGDSTHKPRLLDLLGIGTGYVGIAPGMTYLVMAEEPEEDSPSEFVFINVCNTVLGYMSENNHDVRETLIKMRKLRDAE